jgi:peptidoglycan hydrolase-like protein with peptidoglycan-binding domain
MVEMTLLQAQARLKLLGYDLGTGGFNNDGVSGEHSPETAAALEAFQAKQDPPLPPTGNLDDETVVALFSIPFPPA